MMTTTNDQWVVTYRIEHADGLEIIEMYRGTEHECRRIAANSAPPTWDREGNKVTGFKAIVGLAQVWDHFLEDN